MKSIASIVGDVLTSKETYPKRSRKIKKSSESVEESLDFVQKQRIGPKTLPREIAAREDEEEETSEAKGEEARDQICSASIVEDWSHIRPVLGFVGLHQRQA